MHVLKEFKQCIKQDLRGLYAQLNDRSAVFICSHSAKLVNLRPFGHFRSLNKDGARFLIIHSPRYDGSTVQVDGAGGVIPPVHGDHRYVARHLCNTAFSVLSFYYVRLENHLVARQSSFNADKDGEKGTNTVYNSSTIFIPHTRYKYF